MSVNSSCGLVGIMLCPKLHLNYNLQFWQRHIYRGAFIPLFLDATGILWTVPLFVTAHFASGPRYSSF